MLAGELHPATPSRRAVAHVAIAFPCRSFKRTSRVTCSYCIHLPPLRQHRARRSGPVDAATTVDYHPSVRVSSVRGSTARSGPPRCGLAGSYTLWFSGLFLSLHDYVLPLKGRDIPGSMGHHEDAPDSCWPIPPGCASVGVGDRVLALCSHRGSPRRRSPHSWEALAHRSAQDARPKPFARPKSQSMRVETQPEQTIVPFPATKGYSQVPMTAMTAAPASMATKRLALRVHPSE
jgi:hypothetical protein